MTKNVKHEYLDIYRALGIFAVIIIHVTSFPMDQLEDETFQHFFYMFFNYASHFAVPSFLFLSGIVLFYNYVKRDREGENWVLHFYKKRLLNILVPYLIWSFFYFICVQLINDTNIFFNIKTYFINLATGKNYTHLYYFVIILQLYILFPLFLKLVISSDLIRKKFVFLAVIVQIVFFLINKWFIGINQTGSMFITYFLHFCVGAYIGMELDKVFRYLKSRSWLLGCIFITSMLIYIFSEKIYYRWFTDLLPYKAYINFFIYYLFTLTASVALLLISKYIFNYRKNLIVGILGKIGNASFTIFLAHPIFLELWRRHIISNYGEYYHYLTWMGGVVALACSWGLYILLKKTRWSWILIGK
ncbi:acyltransferase [Paenibacillus alkalitolerans]|uniref:acyltransferase n=1 Tax=Paenibacillus alkalitolerans TaxID=2799335 RepID=UPI0018F6F915|nr:acyltransferase [Paenibacillus alkalitolerans]